MRQGQTEAVAQGREQGFRVKAVTEDDLAAEAFVAGIEPAVGLPVAGTLLQFGGQGLGDGAPGADVIDRADDQGEGALG
jgi:hypothetical protein